MKILILNYTKNVNKLNTFAYNLNDIIINEENFSITSYRFCFYIM